MRRIRYVLEVLVLLFSRYYDYIILYVCVLC